MKDIELTDEQTARQDIVDNAVYDCILACNPTDTPLEWDIELIGDVRDAVQKVFTEHLKLCTEMEFYPFIELPSPE